MDSWELLVKKLEDPVFRAEFVGVLFLAVVGIVATCFKEVTVRCFKWFLSKISPSLMMKLSAHSSRARLANC